MTKKWSVSFDILDDVESALYDNVNLMMFIKQTMEKNYLIVSNLRIKSIKNERTHNTNKTSNTKSKT